MSDDLAKELDACLDLLLKGESVERCLDRYARHRAELEPLLRTAQLIHLSQPVAVPDRLRAAGRSRLLSTAASRPYVLKAPAKHHGWVVSLRAAAAAALVATLISSGAVVASAGALPDEPLYGVKRAVETVQVALTPSEQRSGLHLQFAERRLNEEAELARRGRGAGVERAAREYGHQVDRALGSIEQGRATGQDLDAAIERFTEHLDLHEAKMTAVLEQVPPQARAGIERAIEVSRQGQERAREIREQRKGSPASEPGAATTKTPLATPSATSSTATPAAATPASGDGRDSGKRDGQGDPGRENPKPSPAAGKGGR